MMKRMELGGDLGRTFLRRLGGGFPRYGYIGWVGHGNLGDETMYQAARSLAGDRIEVMRTANRERLLHLLLAGGPRLFPKVFLGGGTLVNQGYLPIVEECLRQGLRISSLGTGVGSAGFGAPETSLDRRWLQALGKFEHVGVRGPVSLEKLRQAGFEAAEVVGDLALALTTDKPIADWGARRFLFNAAPPALPEDRASFAGIFSSLARLVRHLVQSGWSPVPVGFDPRDHEAIEHVLTEAGCPIAPARPEGFLEYSSIARTAAMSIGVRLHSSVLASCCGLPNILIGYRDKCADYAATVRMESNFIPAARFDESILFQASSEIIARPDRVGAALHAECLSWKRIIREYLERVVEGGI